MPGGRARREPAAPGDPPVRGEPRDYARMLGRRLTRRYVALGPDAVILYTEPILIRRDPLDLDWLAFEAWREQPGNVVERMAPAVGNGAPGPAAGETSARTPTILTS